LSTNLFLLIFSLGDDPFKTFLKRVHALLKIDIKKTWIISRLVGKKLIVGAGGWRREAKNGRGGQASAEKGPMDH